MSATALKRLAIGLFLLGTGLIAWGGGPEENPIAMTAVVFLIAGALVHFRGRQVAARVRNTGTASPLRDQRPDVLYLRSFGMDASTMRRKLMAGLSTEEEDLAEAVRPLGDLIAIGRPGEPLPLPGAARMYCSNDEWKDAVVARMREASLVIIRAGQGEGLLWECEQAACAARKLDQYAARKVDHSRGVHSTWFRPDDSTSDSLLQGLPGSVSRPGPASAHRGPRRWTWRGDHRRFERDHDGS